MSLDEVEALDRARLKSMCYDGDGGDDRAMVGVITTWY